MTDEEAVAIHGELTRAVEKTAAVSGFEGCSASIADALADFGDAVVQGRETLEEVRLLPAEFRRAGLMKVIEGLDTTIACGPESPRYFCVDDWAHMLVGASAEQVGALLADEKVKTPKQVLGWLEKNVGDQREGR